MFSAIGSLIDFFIGYLLALLLIGIPAELIANYVRASGGIKLPKRKKNKKQKVT